MSYVLTVDIDREGVYEVLCTHCRESLGTMPIDIMMGAIRAKGPILCPGCRLRHCDYCGRITRYRLPTTQGAFASGLYRICPLCVQKKSSMKLPEFEKSITSHIIEPSFLELIKSISELLTEDACLSSTPKLKKTVGKGGENDQC